MYYIENIFYLDEVYTYVVLLMITEELLLFQSSRVIKNQSLHQEKRWLVTSDFEVERITAESNSQTRSWIV